MPVLTDRNFNNINHQRQYWRFIAWFHTIAVGAFAFFDGRNSMRSRLNAAAAGLIGAGGCIMAGACTEREGIVATEKSVAQTHAGEITVRHSKIESYMQRADKAGFHGAVMIVDDAGGIVYSGAFGVANDATGAAFTTDTAVDIGSNAKAFVAAGILKLEEQGKLKTSDTLATHFPNVPEDKAGITVHQLLTHTAGFPDEYAQPYAERTREEMEQEIFAQPLMHAPGSDYSYSDMGYALASALVERASGEQYRDYMRKTLLRPAGLDSTDYRDGAIWEYNGGAVPVARGYANDVDADSPADMPDLGWTPIGGGGILSTVSDGAKWHSALVRGDILNAASTAKMFDRHVVTSDGRITVWYGYGWSIYNDPRRGNVISHSGATASHNWYSQYLADDGLMIIAASNRIDGEYKDANGDGLISDDEILSEVIYASQLGSRLAMALHQDDFTILPAFMGEAESD